MIGESRRTSLTVEAGKVNEFRLATGLSTEATPEIAPATFPVVIEHFGPTIISLLVDLGYDTRRILHGEESITYPDGPLRVGDELSGTIEITNVTEKNGSSGLLRLVTVLIDLRHRDGRPAVLIERVLALLPGAAST